MVVKTIIQYIIYNITITYGEHFNREIYKGSIFLGIHKIDDYYAIYAAIMPYFNEIVNLLTITILKPTFGISLFYHFTTNFHPSAG